jgi:Zn-dependent peptidase ImmA (M78 family)
MVCPFEDSRPAALRHDYHARFGGDELPVPVEAIAVDWFGLALGEADLAVSGLLIPEEKRIWVNRNDPRERRRLALAHAIGHWVCHCQTGEGEPLHCRAADLVAGTSSGREREASAFSADLITPGDAVREAWTRQPDIEVAAERFGVPVDAMHWRLNGLGLVEDRPVAPMLRPA